MNSRYCLFVAWGISLMALLGSLYLSEIMKLPPCVLCWYQRIFVYPLTIILPMAVIYKDQTIYRYVLPLTISGGIIAIYHYLLTVKIIPENSSLCSSGISCAINPISWFGSINIPLLSFLSFFTITLLMLVYKKLNSNE